MPWLSASSTDLWREDKHIHANAIYSDTRNTYTTRMWANAQRDGRPAEQGGALCSTPQTLADAHY